MADADAPTLAIRPAGPGDVARLLELYKLLDVSPEPEMPLAAAQARFQALHADPRHRIYVAERGGRVVGTFALIFVGGLSHDARDAAVVEDVVVDPAEQRGGIGRQMMDFAMRECVKRDGRCYKLVLSSHLQRASAHRFYESLGYRRHGYSYLIDPQEQA